MAIILHSSFCVLSLFIGVLVFYRPKGTKLHKILGWFFWGAMATSTLASFFIYSEHWSLIHILSIFVAFWLVRSIYVTRMKPRNWRRIHAQSMGAVFIAIIIAGAGVLVRDVLMPGNFQAGYIASAIVSIPAIYILNKKTSRIK